MARIVIISALCLSWLVLGCPSWTADLSIPTWQRALAYAFFHGNVFHLAANCLALWYTYSPRRRDNVSVLIVSFIISLLVYPIATRPIVGFSNVIFASAGLHTPSFRSKWWKSQSVLVYLGTMLVMLLIPNISALTHIVSFIIGVLCASVIRQYKSLEAYAGRYLR